MSSPKPSANGRVTRDYAIENLDPLSGEAGETLTYMGKTDPWEDNPAWLWLFCQDARGKSGWVAANLLTVQGNEAVLRVDYSAQELSAQVGDAVTILNEESGWYWCRAADDREGWLPISHVAVGD
jgi:SH3-like domain-containing protein